MTRGSAMLRWLCLALLAALVLPEAQALDRDLTLSQFHHSSWTDKDGAPLATWELEETPDGWLWLGGRRGLYRFDGLQFERFELASGSPLPSVGVTRLLTAPTGDLWITLRGGGISRIRGDAVTHYGTADGLPPRSVQAIAIDLDGTVWAITNVDLLRFDGSRWVRIAAAWGLAPDDLQPQSLLVDAWGTLWLDEARGAWALRRGAARFERVPADLGGYSLQTIDGRLWALGDRDLRPAPVLDAVAAKSSNPWLGRRHSARLVDRNRNLWTAYCEAGICRSRLPAVIPDAAVAVPLVEERFDRRHGLSGDLASHFIEDRNGSLWVATQSGLDRFRRSLFVPVDTADGNAMLLLPEPDGSVTVLGAGSSTYREPRRWRVDRQAEALPLERLVEVVHRDRNGRVWMAGADGLTLHAKAGRFTPWPDKIERPGYPSIASDAGGLWIASDGAPLLRYEPDKGRFVEPDAPELRQLRPSVVAAGPDGRLWFGVGENRVLGGQGGHWRNYTADDGLDVGSVTSLYAGAQTFVVSELGVALLYGDRFHRIALDDAEVLAGVDSIIETPDGQVWFNALKGVVRVSVSELLHQVRDPQHHVRYRLFDALDGHSGGVQRGVGTGTAALGADGRLWFITSPGRVVWLDPRRLDDPVPAPMPAVRSLEAAGTLYRPGQAIELPALTQGLSLRYTALGAAIPERVRFRYQLEGLEATWTETGARREVSYANLGPGAYVFRVQAGTSDGVWAESPATLAFSIRPAFFQTAAFQVLCTTAAAGLLWLLYGLRVRQVEARAQQQLGVRLNERERIARDLHDTLLQGVTGLTLHVRAAASQVAPDSPVRARLEHALTRANEVMVEGRERVGALRRVQTETDELEARLRHAAEALAAQWGGPTTHALVVIGTPRQLHAAIADEAYWIVREALANAFQHARARHIHLRINYGPKALELEVGDDGTGFDTAAPRPPGHFGLTGLQERASRIEAVLELRSGAGGTVVTLTVPGALIYAGAALFAGV